MKDIPSDCVVPSITALSLIPTVHIAPSTGCFNEELFEKLKSYRIGLPDKGVNAYKMENKYILRMKACGNRVIDDGYKWRKYGQKYIKNNPNPRSYYKCTNPKCNAKRQVERSTEDPEILLITYEGLHLHYTNSHIFESQMLKNISIPKKPKIHSLQYEEEKQIEPHISLKVDKLKLKYSSMEDDKDEFNHYKNIDCSQGLLEDIVPFMVRYPCNQLQPQ